MVYIKANVPRPKANSGGSFNPRTGDGITLFDLDDVLHYPSRDENGVIIRDNIVLKPNAYAITLYATSGKSEITSNSEGETDNEGFKPQLVFNHPGNEQAIREFKHNWVGRNIGAIIKQCNKPYADIMGDRCNPLKLQASYTGNNDASNNVITLAAAGKGEDIGMYLGTIPMEEPLAVVEADAVTIAAVGSGQYQLTGGAAPVKIIDLENVSHDQVITLLGSSVGTSPIIESGGKFLLKDGLDWTAKSESQITFRIFKDGDASFKFIEQSRF